ncbi:isochorismatase family protein [Sporosarcina sp. FSL K6-3457]|uniref:isochorismatase family protein n=1 Tax=Sporosarcina sp. FSL K6-3457 TaxID=2978204 RepID=UPI0030F7F443
MAIPTILPYPMPVESGLLTSKVEWTINPKRAVLLIHDMQQYFLDAFNLKESPIVELLANIRMLKANCAKLGIPVVYSVQPGGQSTEQRGLLQDFWGPGINDGPYQKQIIEELLPSDEDIVLTKWRYSAFQKTDLLELMKQRGRNQLLVCGIYAHIGCLLTSCEAFMQDIQPFFVTDAVADFSLEKHKMAITYAAERCAVTMSTQQLIEELNGEGSSVHIAQSDNAYTLTQQSIREDVAMLIQVHPLDIGEQDNLINIWGLDSVRIMTLVERWRRSGVEITFVELAEHPSLAHWWELISAQKKQALPNLDYFTG